MAQPIAFGPEAEAAEVAALPPNVGEFVRRAYQRFRERSEAVDHAYFAAFAVSAPDRYGAAGDQHDLTSARQEALRRCARNLPPDAAPCRILLTRTPVGFDEAMSSTLSASASRGFRKYLERAAPKAFAIGPLGAWAAHYNSPKDLAWARARALANCEEPPKIAPGACRVVTEED